MVRLCCPSRSRATSVILRQLVVPLIVLVILFSAAALPSAVTVAQAQQTGNLSQLVSAKEDALHRLAIRALDLFDDRCSALTVCNETSSHCSVYACGNYFPGSRGFECNAVFGQNPAQCGATCGGLIRSMNASVLRYPPGVAFDDGEVQAFTCSSRLLQPDFEREYRNGQVTAWEYIGHASGSIRIYPGASQDRVGRGSCTDYDARLRPWYIAASSGPKDVVLVFDISSSMDSPLDAMKPGLGSRLRATQNAIIAILNSLTQNDRVAVVTFDDGARVIGASDLMVAATPSNIAALIATVNSITTGGGTSFYAGFSAAFDVLTRSQNTGANCNSVILFLSDGLSRDLQRQLLTNIDRWQALLPTRAVIFTYSMGSSADTQKLQAVACANEGVWDRIPDGVDPLTRMRGYFAYLASGINATTVRWTSVYTDAFGLGEMVTAALPVYARLGDATALVAVIGTDVTMAELSQYGDSVTAVIDELFRRSSVCVPFALEECVKQQLRSETSSGYVCPEERSIASCRAQGSTSSTCNPVSGDLDSVLCEPIRDANTRVVAEALPMSNVESQCCFSCLNTTDPSNVTVSGEVGRGRVGAGAPNTPSVAVHPAVSSTSVLILTLLLLVALVPR